jgi:uncharacterized protein (TIGR02266 family)
MRVFTEQTPHDREAGYEGRSGRLPLEVPVQLENEMGAHGGTTKNVGTGGLFVATIRSLPVGHRVTVRLSTTPGDPRSVAALAEVRWTRPFAGSDDRPAGLGLRFIDTPVRTAILVSELQRSGQPDKF